jgi:hypothetical protein
MLGKCTPRCENHVAFGLLLHWTMTPSSFALAIGLIATASAIAGCSNASGTEDVTTEGALGGSCGAEKYQAALERYRKAVYASKDRLAGKLTCDPEEPQSELTMSGIAEEAAAAVLICPDFKEVIRKSPYAEPLRQALGDSLTLKSLTGELLVLFDSQWQNWTGVEQMIVDTTMWNWRGASDQAWDYRIEFKTNGKAVYSSQINDQIEPKEATYRVEAPDGEKAPRKIIVTVDGRSTTFELSATRTDDEGSVGGLFVLTPQGSRSPIESFSSLSRDCGL